MYNIFVQKIGEDQATRIASETARDIGGYMWANNNRIVFIIHKDEIGVYDKSGFKIDLKEYVTDDLIVYFEDYNSWLVNYENGKYKIIDSYIWKK